VNSIADADIPEETRIICGVEPMPPHTSTSVRWSLIATPVQVTDTNRRTMRLTPLAKQHV